MKVDAIKLRVNTFINQMVDSMFPKGNFISGMANATVKFYVEQNMYMVDNYLLPFADKDGDIDTERFLCLLEEQIFSGGKTTIDIGPYLQEYVPENFSNMIPDKIIVTKDDIEYILSERKRTL